MSTYMYRNIKCIHSYTLFYCIIIVAFVYKLITRLKFWNKKNKKKDKANDLSQVICRRLSEADKRSSTDLIYSSLEKMDSIQILTCAYIFILNVN